MTNKKRGRARTSVPPVRNMIGSMIEELGADAVVVIWSSTKRGKTHVNTVSFGNSLATSGLITHAYETETVDYILDEDDESDFDE